MNARDVLFYGDRTLKQTLEHVPADRWDVVGATSGWTVKDVLAHLTSYELVLGDVLEHTTDSLAATPMLDQFRKEEKKFSDAQVEQRKTKSRDAIMKEYDAAHERVMQAIKGLTEETLRMLGTIPWYGAPYSLDDFIVYNNYAHKREHCGMIRLFLNRPKG